MITVKDLVTQLAKMVNSDPKYGQLPVIYATDDEGNSYHHVQNIPGLATVEDLDERYLEISEDSNMDNANCVIIN